MSDADDLEAANARIVALLRENADLQSQVAGLNRALDRAEKCARLTGGPYTHKLDIDGTCRVCGYLPLAGDDAPPGCPYTIRNLDSYRPPGRPLASAGEAQRAASELRELLATEGKAE